MAESQSEEEGADAIKELGEKHAEDMALMKRELRELRRDMAALIKLRMEGGGDTPTVAPVAAGSCSPSVASSGADAGGVA